MSRIDGIFQPLMNLKAVVVETTKNKQNNDSIVAILLFVVNMVVGIVFSILRLPVVLLSVVLLLVVLVLLLLYLNLFHPHPHVERPSHKVRSCCGWSVGLFNPNRGCSE